MSSHLARRGGIWWARLVVPKPLRQLAGRREFSQSTRTHELHIAKLVSSVLLADWRRQLLALEDHPMSSDILKLIGPATALAAGAHLRLTDAVESTGIKQDELLRLAAGGRMPLYCRVSQVPGYVLSIEDLEFANEAQGAPGGYVLPSPRQMPDSATPAVLSALLAIPKGESAAIAGAIMAENLEAVDVLCFEAPNSPGKFFVPNDAFRVNVGALEIRADAVAIVHRHMGRKITPAQITQAQELQKAAAQGAAASAGRDAYKLFNEALEAYATENSGLPHDLSSQTEQMQRKKGCQLFSEFMGNLPLGEIDAGKLRAFRDGPLKTLPARANNLPIEFRRSTIKESVEAIRLAGSDWPFMSVDRQQERMQWLGRFFAWLKADGWLNDNPAALLQGETGLTKAERKDIGRDREDDDGRGPFSTDELKLIFGQSWFQTGSGAQVKKPRIWYPFEYWLPLLGVFGGCRIGEASQLHLSDVKKVGTNVWCLDINESTKDKSLKNEQSKRMVPLHPLLIDLGFLDYCERLRQGGFRRVFPELTWAKTDARYAKEPIRKMSAMLNALGMPRDSMHVFHCLRHNTNNALARVPMASLPFADENLKKYIRYTVLGHKVGNDVNEKSYMNTTAAEMFVLVRELAYGLPQIGKFDIDFGVSQVRAALDNKEGERRGREDMGPLNSD